MTTWKWTALAGLLVLIAAGCAEDENLALPNTPPETYMALGDSAHHATVYIQTIHWWGDDADGEVA
jgi:hypothetical protein